MYTSNIETFFGVNILYIKLIFSHFNLMQFIFLVAFLFLSDKILVHETNVCVCRGREKDRERDRERKS